MKKIILTMIMFAAIAQANTAVAYWTGKQKMVRTVTGKMAWDCEYNYSGKKFWRVFEFSCPSQVEVY